MNVWKIASRWSEDGRKESSILDIFRDKEIVFVADPNANKIKKDDLIAISDGKKVVAVAQATDNSCKITEMRIDDESKKRFDYDCPGIIAVKVKLYNLNADETYEYRIGRFHAINEKSEHIKALYKKYHDSDTRGQFSIQASTYTFKSEKPEQRPIIDGTNYIIPIYQRPYSWGEVEVSKFIQDIFISFWGYEQKMDAKEPMFIGTMQLSEKSYSQPPTQYIIDGQQRITTFCLLVKCLQLKYQHSNKINTIDLKSLIKTKVNNGTQQKLYEECIALTSIDDNTSNEELVNNQYFENLKTIDSVFQEKIEGQNEHFDREIEKFLEHILTNIHFVVIETRAGLSKTIQIFNAINTTGLDLNGGDIFKVRMYEYLTTKKGKNDKCFNEISNLYEKIDELNKENKFWLSINDMLSIYRDILVSKYDMPNTLFDLNQNTFFDRLFDTILGNQKWDNFSKADHIDLSIEDLDKIIENRYTWEKEYKNFDEETKCIYRFFQDSRYRRYRDIIFIYWFKRDHTELKELNAIVTKLNKLFFSYSVIFDRAIFDIKSFMHGLYKNIYNKESMNIIEAIDTKLKSNVPYYNGESKVNLERVLSSNIAYNAKKKYLICRLSAMLEGDKKVSDIFETSVDIEHIRPQTDNAEDASEWDVNLKNSIGNLVLLESHINRSISNNKQKKSEGYKKSKFKIVKKLVNKEDYNFENWNVEECKKRLEIETKKIIDYILN